MSKSQYVFIASKSKMQVIDTAKSVAELQKRIPKKKTPYPEDVVVLRVDKNRILHYLETEEYENATLIDNALMQQLLLVWILIPQYPDLLKKVSSLLWMYQS